MRHLCLGRDCVQAASWKDSKPNCVTIHPVEQTSFDIPLAKRLPCPPIF